MKWLDVFKNKPREGSFVLVYNILDDDITVIPKVMKYRNKHYYDIEHNFCFPLDKYPYYVQINLHI